MTADKTPPPALPLHRLVAFCVDPSHRLPPPLQHTDRVNVDAPGNFVGWGLHVRGATMFLVSPAGWAEGKASGKHRELWDKNGPRHVYGPIALAHVTLIWQGASADFIDKVQRYDLPEMKAVGSAAPQEAKPIDPKELGDP